MIREREGRFTCTDCGHVYSSMLGDDEIPETCHKCKKGVDFMGKKANESVDVSKKLLQKFEEGYDSGHVSITLPDTIVLQTENGSLEAVVSPIARQSFDKAIKDSMK